MKGLRGAMTEALRVGEAFFRLDAIDDLAYPMHTSMKVVVRVFPVFIQFFIAVLVGATATRRGDIGGDYFTFAAVGLAVSALMDTALRGFGARLQHFQQQGVLETLLVEPVPWRLIPVAMNTWHVLFGAGSSALVLGVAALLGADFRLAGLLPLLLVAVAAVLAATAIGVVSASILVLAKRSEPIVQIYGLAASLLGGSVFPIELLPGWLRWISFLIPHTYAIRGAREVIMTTPPEHQFGLGLSLLVLLAFGTVVSSLGFYLFGRALEYARRTGLLGTY